SARNCSFWAASFRLMMALRLPLFQTREPDSERNGSPPGGSILVTLAPLSASSMPAIGPEIPHERSRTLTPSITPAMHLTPYDDSLGASCAALTADGTPEGSPPPAPYRTPCSAGAGHPWPALPL